MREVVFVLLPDVVLLDVAGPAEAFRSAELNAPGSFRLRFTSPQPILTAQLLAAIFTIGRFIRLNALG